MSDVLKCDVCDKKFAPKSTLSTHQKTAKFCLAKKAMMASSSASAGSDSTSSSVVKPDVVADESSSALKDPTFIEEIKRYYEDKIRDRDERISTLESLIEKMEKKIDKYQITIMSLALSSFAARRGTPERCTNPECEGCRTEDAIEKTLIQEMNKL
jgi:hypothetical protein